MQRDAARYAYDFDSSPDVAPDGLTRLLGGKGANLAVMVRQLRLPVPPGFTITTEACRAYLSSGRWPDGLDAELRAGVERLGRRVGRTFGDEADPLLVSVRSGAPVSMPGMMDTVLNVGLTARSADGLARVTADREFAQDCLRRLAEGYRGVIGVDDVPDDPWLQLRKAVEAVFRSWNGERARAYRRREGIPDDLGTAVTVQAMVFGNRGPDSGTGVLFTRNPSTGEPVLYGDVMFDAQGEDVVAGGRRTEPLSALDGRLPDVARELRGVAEALERHLRDVADIEFTIERGRLWLLQTRVGKRSPRAGLRMAIDMAEDPAFPLSREEAVSRVAAQLAEPPKEFVREDPAGAPIAIGLPASPGVATGAIATSSESAETAADRGQAVILVRPETSPEDVPGMSRSVGVLTASGGLASHAAVVARGWGIPAVVGATALEVDTDEVRIGGRMFRAGERLTIDGSTGEVFAGALAGRWQQAPEVATLLRWAAELGVGIAARGPAPVPPQAGESAADRVGSRSGVASGDVARALLVKGMTTSDALAECLFAEPSRIAALSRELLDRGVAESTPHGLRLTTDGRLGALEAFAEDRVVVGERRCEALLGEFQVLDGRVKQIVTAWQVRDMAGEQVVNDHNDAEYDGRVLDDLASVHGDTVEWLDPLAQQLRRFDVYRARLAKALQLARDGDQRYVASPRVDSYHSVWFELHEDLIRLAGRRRAEEAAAGRA